MKSGLDLTGSSILFRIYDAADSIAVREVLLDAFPGEDEATLVEQLRADKDVVIELVAEKDGRIVGEVMVSRMQSPEKTLGLAPIGVLSSLQGSGIGTCLMQAAIDQAAKEGWGAIFLLGDPAYYNRFGFSVDAAAPFETPYPKEYFQALELEAGFLKTCDRRTAYAAAFEAL